jgi:hypothetical protein
MPHKNWVCTYNYLGGVGLTDVRDSHPIDPAVLTAPRGKIAHVLHDLLQTVLSNLSVETTVERPRFIPEHTAAEVRDYSSW